MAFNPNSSIDRIVSELSRRNIPGNIIMMRTASGWTLMVVSDNSIHENLLEDSRVVAGTSAPKVKLSAAIRELAKVFDIVLDIE